jgi:predicted MPP superfamily phosphohydrolase
MRTRARTAGWTLAVAGTALLAYGFLVEPNRPRLRRLSVPCAGLIAPVRILLFSDVDFPRARAGRALVRKTVATERPDAIFLAGDYLDRPGALRDPATLAAAGAELAALPAPSGRFVALGEAESGHAETIRSSWSPGTAIVGANDPHVITTPGGDIDLFIADVRTDPAPWGVVRDEDRPALVCRGRHVTSTVRYDAPASRGWGDVEITLAFRIDDPDAFVDFRFGWRPGSPPDAGDGWRLERDAYAPAFTLLPRFPGDHRVSGRVASGYVPWTGIWNRARIVLGDDGTATRVRARFWPERGKEPDVWLVDVRDEGPDRRHAGTIGFAARFGERRIADLRVVAPDGRVLLDEPFDDRVRFDRTWSESSRLAAWARRIDGLPKLVLTHHPDVVLDLALIGAPPPALVVAGHTHGGQIAIPGFGPPFTSTHLPRRLAAGLGRWRGIPLFVTVGIGTSVLPIRLFVPPEVDLLTLTPTSEATGPIPPHDAATMPAPGDPR